VKDERVTFLPGPISEEELAELYRQHPVLRKPAVSRAPRRLKDRCEIAPVAKEIRM